MYWDVILVKPLDNFRLYVELVNGQKGVFDLKPYLNQGTFKELRNRTYFNQVSIVHGAITWPNEQDIAPETLINSLSSAG